MVLGPSKVAFHLRRPISMEFKREVLWVHRKRMTKIINFHVCLHGSPISVVKGYTRLSQKFKVKEYKKESWQSWYDRTGSGQLLRKASTAVCILNEIIFGVSDDAIEALEAYYMNIYRLNCGTCRNPSIPH